MYPFSFLLVGLWWLDLLLWWSSSPLRPRHQNGTVQEKCNIACVHVAVGFVGQSVWCTSSVCYVWQCICVAGCRCVCTFGDVRVCFLGSGVQCVRNQYCCVCCMCLCVAVEVSSLIAGVPLLFSCRRSLL